MKTNDEVSFRHRALVLLGMLTLGACGGGGGGDDGGSGGSGGGGPSATFSLTTQSMAFSAAGPTAPTPVRQPVGGTVSGTVSGTLYILVSATGSAVSNVSPVSISGNTGTALVSVVPPAVLGSGTFTSSIQVRACVNDSTCATGELSGSPKTVNVTYTIGQPTVADTVMPHVVTAGIPGQVIIRGHGFTGTANVSFGAASATAFTVVSDSEIRASYPALGQGAHSIALSGGATFSGSVVAVDPIAFAAELLTFPEQPSRVRRVIYDAERQSLYVAASFASSANNKLWRFRYDQGAWTSAEVIAIPEMEDVALTPDGSRLLALTSQSVLELDSANPAGGALKTTMAPADVLSQLIPVTDTTFLSDTKHAVALSSLAMANDGTAIVTARYRDVGARAYSFFYSPAAGTFTQIQPFTSFGMYAYSGAGASSPAIASADGSTVLVAAIYNQGDPAEPILQFNASTGKTTRNSPAVRQLWGRPVAMDGTASRIIPYTGPTIVDNDRVYDANYTLLGEIPKASGIIANGIVVNPSGTRAYVLTQNPSPFNTTVYTYDLTASPNGGIFPTAGPEISITSPTAGDMNLVLGTITPDGGTVFFVGDGGVSVVPVP